MFISSLILDIISFPQYHQLHLLFIQRIFSCGTSPFSFPPPLHRHLLPPMIILLFCTITSIPASGCATSPQHAGPWVMLQSANQWLSDFLQSIQEPCPLPYVEQCTETLSLNLDSTPHWTGGNKELPHIGATITGPIGIFTFESATSLLKALKYINGCNGAMDQLLHTLRHTR